MIPNQIYLYHSNHAFVAFSLIEYIPPEPLCDSTSITILIHRNIHFTLIQVGISSYFNDDTRCVPIVPEVFLFIYYNIILVYIRLIENDWVHKVQYYSSISSNPNQ